MMRQQPDIGESAASINRRADDESWPHIKRELETGATLLRVPRLQRSYPDRGDGPYCVGISDLRLKKLVRAGVLKFVGVDRYALSEGGTA
ncbi:hypothetical protein [Ferrovibrio sp.]|uniref:hypothetical protein n=1 Tax=Ferrovibrio sp. TaxID=1917215 RepID=UPI0035B0D6F0